MVVRALPRGEKIKIGNGFWVALAALAFAWLSAVQALNNDQTIFWLTALQHLDGQVIYRDFFLPYGPLTGWLLVPFMWLLPTGGWAITGATATLNAVVSLLAYRLVLHATGQTNWALWSALLMALAFLPIFGLYYNDQLAYAFLFAAFVCMHVYRFGTRFWMAGFLAALSFYAKQPVALAGWLVLAVYLFGGADKRNRMQVLFGFLAAHVAIVACIALTASLSQFWFYHFRLPYEFTRQPENGKTLYWLIERIVFPFRINLWKEPSLLVAAFAPLLLLSYAAYGTIVKIALRRRPHAEAPAIPPHTWPLFFCMLSSVACSALLGRHFAHVLFAAPLLYGLLLPELPHVAKKYAGIGFVAMGLLLGGTAWYMRVGLKPTYGRLVSSEVRPIQMRHLRPYHTEQQYYASLNSIIAYLRLQKGSVAYLGETLDLIAIGLNRAPQQANRMSVLMQPSHVYGHKVPAEIADRVERDLLAGWQKKCPDFIVKPIKKYNLENRNGAPFAATAQFVAARYRVVLRTHYYEVLKRIN